MEIVANGLLVGGLLLITITAIQVVSARGWVPESTLLAGVGLLVGAAYATMPAMVPDIAARLNIIVRPSLPAEAYLWIFLPPLVFQAALSANVRDILPDAAPILLLAVVAVFVATGFIGWTLSLISSHALAVCLLLGAIVAITDPSAVISIFRDVGAPSRLSRLVEGESLLNDAAAIAIVGVLVAAIGGDPAHARVSDAVVTLTFSLGGGIAIGYLVGRFVVALLPSLNQLPVAAATLSLAVPYTLYVAADQMLHASGVIAVATAGLVISAFGPTRLSTRNWSHLNVIWQQFAVLAGAVIFLLAAVQVPDLLSAMTVRDMELLAVTVVAAFMSRLIVLFGLFPLLSFAGLSKPVDHRYKLAIAWGGMRGAVSLVLALGVAQNAVLPADVRQFVASLAAAFVLVSLFVNGITLRWFIRWLGLTALSPQQQMLQRQAVILSGAEIDAAIARLAEEFELPGEIAGAVRREYQAEMTAGTEPFAIEEALTERERLSIGLVTLATREHALVPEYGSGVISIRNLDALNRNTSRMIDAAREEGRIGYNREAKTILAMPANYRFAVYLADRFDIRWPLARTLTDRFELLICRRVVLQRLIEYNNTSLNRLIGGRMAAVLEGVLKSRLAGLDGALRQLRSREGEYLRALERRMLLLFALRQGFSVIETMRAESILSAEIAERMNATLQAAWDVNVQRPTPSLKAACILRPDGDRSEPAPPDELGSS